MRPQLNYFLVILLGLWTSQLSAQKDTVRLVLPAKFLKHKLQKADLTPTQWTQFYDLSAQLRKDMVATKKRCNVSKELMRQRDGVFSELREKGIPRTERLPIIAERLNLTELQTQGFTELLQLKETYKAEMLASLTDKQRQKVAKAKPTKRRKKKIKQHQKEKIALDLSTPPIPSWSLPTELQKLVDAKGELVFTDDFNREEEDNTKEQLGKSWNTSSESRAQGHKQADLKDNFLQIIRPPIANHQAVIRHDLPINNGIVAVRFQIFDKMGVSFNFSDPASRKIARAGHVCQVLVKPEKVRLTDQLTGKFAIDLWKKRKAGVDLEEVNKILENKTLEIEHTTTLETWHLLHILLLGDAMSAWIDGQKIGTFRSEGFAHPIKQNFAFYVPLKANLDDLTVWGLE